MAHQITLTQNQIERASAATGQAELDAVALDALTDACARQHTCGNDEARAMAKSLLSRGLAWLGRGHVLVDERQADTWKTAPLLVSDLPDGGNDDARALRAYASECKHRYQQRAAEPMRVPDADADASATERLLARPPLGPNASEADRIARAEERASLAREIADEERQKFGGL